MLVRRNRQTNTVPKIVGLENWPGYGVEIGKDNSLKINKMNEQLNLFDTVNEATNGKVYAPVRSMAYDTVLYAALY